ncbi:MAG: hypothetical protein ACYC7D_05830 [Nitrososphaerales archaeon]
MKTTMAILGIVILVIGVALVGYGASSPIKQTTTQTTTQDVTLTPQTTRVIDPNGLWSPSAQVLSKGEAITATFTVTNYTSSQGPVFLYLQNISQFIAWGSCAPCTSPSLTNQTLPSSGTYTLSWTVPANGSYYFTIDDESYGAAASAQFSSSGNAVSSVPVTTTSQNTTLLYSGAALIVVGAIILAFGFIATGKKSMGK